MNATAVGTFGLVPVPGTSFNITQFFLRTTLTGQETSLAAGDYLFLQHSAEGPFLREICSDVMSLQILVRSSVAGLKFGITLREGGTTKTLALLCTIPSANTWTLLTFPNLPSFVSSGAGLALTPGSAGFYLTVSLAVGTTNTAPANGTWQSGAFVQAAGADNFASKPVNSTFDCAYISLEPGPLCSNPPMDRPFTDNLRDCWRYYEKSYEYATKAGTSTYQGTTGTYNYVNNVTMNMGARFKASKATTPSVSTYSPVTGALNVVAASNGETTVGAINGPTTESPFYSLTTSATLVVGQYTWAQWIADTGW
jgi:hypothetical protein